MTAKAPETFNLSRLPTPIGTALLVSDADGVLRALDWEDHDPRMRELLRLQYGAVILQDARPPKDIAVALRTPVTAPIARAGHASVNAPISTTLAAMPNASPAITNRGAI